VSRPRIHPLVVLLLVIGSSLAAEAAWAAPKLTWKAVSPGAPPGGKGTHVAVFIGAPNGRGEPILVRGDRRPMNPASVMKLATAWVALSTLGPDHRFTTSLYEGPRDVLYVEAAGDPALAYRDLLEIAARLHHRGHRSFRELVIDDGIFSEGTTPPHFDDKKTDDAYRAEVGAFSVESGAVRVRVRPGAKPGDRPRVSLYPPSAAVKVNNRGKTRAKGKSAVSVGSRTIKGQTHVDVGGRIPKSARAGVMARKKVYQVGAFAAEAFRQALASQGIKIREGVRFGERPKGGRRILRHASPPLIEILGGMNRHSNNFMAEMLLRQLDPAKAGKSFEAGAERVAAALRAMTGAGPKEIRVSNGSGLYDANRLSARAIGGLLSEALRSHWASEFAATLALAGREGTLKKRLTRLWFRGKTGTLNRAIALAGYLDVAGLGRVPVVVLLSGKLEGRAADCRTWIDRLVLKIHDKLARTK
jgi:serine-type D-Ala-D-Ala carboxypeptidase/endopeptidase (penicillin-binding protein 4)